MSDQHDINEQVSVLLGLAHNLLNTGTFTLQGSALAQAQQIISDVAKLGKAVQDGTLRVVLTEQTAADLEVSDE